MNVPFAAPQLSEEDIARVTAVLQSGWLTTGEQVAAFEAQLAVATARKQALAGSSLTGMMAPLLASMPDFGSAAFPAWTFSSVPMEFITAGKTVKLYDVDPYRLMLPAQAYGEDVLVPTHFAGNEYPVSMLKYHNPTKTIIDDAAHLEPRKIEGSLASLYSFYATKPVCAGEGGALVTDDEGLAGEVRSRLLHGFSSSAMDRYHNPSAGLYDVVRQGWKANMTDMAAALGLGQLESADRRCWDRKQVRDWYRTGLADAGIRMLHHGPHSSYHLAIVVLGEGIDRARVRAHLAEAGITTSVHFTPLYRLTFWCQLLYGMSPKEFVESGAAKDLFPVCEYYAERVLSIPMSSAITSEQAGRVCASLMGAVLL